MKKNLLNKIILSFLCLASVPYLFAQEKSDESAEKSVQCSTTKRYFTHVLTGGASHITLYTLSAIGTLIGYVAVKRDLPTTISRALGITPEGFLCENGNIIASVGMTPMIAGMIAGFYLMYKMPQFTDTYLLKLKKQRTTKQNIAIFALRALVPYPVGVLVGEVVNDAMDSDDSQKQVS